MCSKTCSVVRLDELSLIAAQCGLEMSAAISLEKAESELSKAAEHLQTWQDKGFAAEMQYMKRPVELFKKLSNFLPTVRSVITFVISYNTPSGITRQPEQPGSQGAVAPFGYGRIARYAWGSDYHLVLKKKLNLFLKILAKSFPNLQSRIFTDAVPLLERALASGGGLGFIGKNCMLIRPGIGSFSFLAEVLLNLELEGFEDLNLTAGSKNTVPGVGCKNCTRCITQCPTGALPSPGMLDARKCISYLTIEKKTAFSSWESKAIGNWLFGCDICQEVCPFNHTGIHQSIVSEFSPEVGAGPFIKLDDLLLIHSEADFRSRFVGTPLMRAGREKMLRNACSVVGNTGYFPAVPALKNLVLSDNSQLIKDQAASSLRELENQACGLDLLRIKQGRTKEKMPVLS